MASSSATRRHVLLTGVPGVGKTTLVRRICQHLADNGKKLQGFYTAEKRQGESGAGKRIGFDIIPVPEGVAGPSSPLARLSDNNPQDQRPRVGCYSVDVSSVDLMTSTHLRPGRGGGGDMTAGAATENEVTYYVVDEIGKMELFSSTFKTLVSRLFDSAGGPGEEAGRGAGRGLSRTLRGAGGRGGGPIGRGAVRAATDERVSAESKIVVIATLPVVPNRGKPNPFIEGIRNRPDAILYTVTRVNRDTLFDEIVEHL